MENHLFSRDSLALLLTPQKWRLICSYCPADERPVRRLRHAAWMAGHSHSHAAPELNIILRGEGCQGIDGRIYVACPGTVFIQDGAKPHEVRYPPGCPPSERLNFYFVRNRLVVRLVETGVGRRIYRERWNFIVPVGDLGLVPPVELFRFPPTAPAATVRNRILSTVSLLVLFTIGQGFRPTLAPAPDFTGEVIAQIEKHIRQQTGRNCDLATLADMAGYSRFHFLRLFRKRTGMGLHEYVNRARFEALATMSAAGMRTCAISAALGFAHPSSFIRWRKRHAP